MVTRNRRRRKIKLKFTTKVINEIMLKQEHLKFSAGRHVESGDVGQKVIRDIEVLEIGEWVENGLVDGLDLIKAEIKELEPRCVDE